MIYFPACKINLGLQVLSRRPDGYHNIETCFYPVPWNDVLEVIPATEPSFTFSGLTIAGKEADNLCVKAFGLLKKDFDVPPVHCHLHKIIPVGAGLGGGSSDAASMLVALNEIFFLGISSERLRNYAARLGSDCPFFIESKPRLGSGKGEILAPTQVSLRGKFLVIVSPDIHVSTAEAYQEVRPKKPARALTDILAQPFASWKSTLVNDFEESVFAKYPVLAGLKAKLYESGAVYASLSGSGSSVFGLFDHPQEPGDFAGLPVWSGILND